MKIQTSFRVLAASAASVLVALLVLSAPPAGAASDDVRTVEITVTDRGYEPSLIELTAGEPVRLAFRQEAKSECAHSVKSADLAIETTALPPGETTVVEITPEESGEFTFACGMGMLKGTLIVEAPSAS